MKTIGMLSSPSPHSPSSAPGFAHAESDIGAAFIMALDHHRITALNGGTALIAGTHVVRRQRLSRYR
jgi:hypothetical protein